MAYFCNWFQSLDSCFCNLQYILVSILEFQSLKRADMSENGHILVKHHQHP